MTKTVLPETSQSAVSSPVAVLGFEHVQSIRVWFGILNFGHWNLFVICYLCSCSLQPSHPSIAQPDEKHRILEAGFYGCLSDKIGLSKIDDTI